MAVRFSVVVNVARCYARGPCQCPYEVLQSFGLKFCCFKEKIEFSLAFSICILKFALS